MTRLFSLLLLIAVGLTAAFQPVHITSPARPATVAVNSVSRSAFLAATVSAVVVTTTTSTAAFADEYDDARNAARAKSKQGGGASLMAVPLIGGVALSLPFFLPSILRILGIKNDKLD